MGPEAAGGVRSESGRARGLALQRAEEDVREARSPQATARTISNRLRRAGGTIPVSRIAAMTGFNAETVRRYMRTNAASVWFLHSFCRVMDVNMRWLLMGEGPMRTATARRDAIEAMSDREIGKRFGERLRQRERAAEKGGD